MNIAVIGLQGAVTEHIIATRRAMEKIGLKGAVHWAKDAATVQSSDAAILPGGESTTISKLIEKNGLREALQDLPIFGTCAGMVLLAKEGDGQVQRTGQQLLGRMDFQVNRNAFGRQRESFQTEIDFQGPADATLKDRPFPGVFIRAPCAQRVFGNTQVLAKHKDHIVAVEQGDCLATAFHPELTDDTRIHEYFLKKVQRLR